MQHQLCVWECKRIVVVIIIYLFTYLFFETDFLFLFGGEINEAFWRGFFHGRGGGHWGEMDPCPDTPSSPLKATLPCQGNVLALHCG